MLQKLFRGPSPAKTKFLIAFTRLSSRITDGGLAFTPGIGKISLLGFVESYGSEPFDCAPSTKPVGYSFYSDKFLSVRASDKENTLGKAEISEGYVYDEQYRADIDLTGLRLVLTFQRPAFDSYEQFVGNARVSASTVDPSAWHGDLLILIPSPVFKFPEGRGSNPPYPPAQTTGTKVGKLHKIQNLRFNTIDIVKIGKQTSSREPCVPDILNTPPENVLRLRNGHRE